MKLKTTSDRKWPALAEGVQISGLRRNDTDGGAALIRMRKGARYPKHLHHGWEDVFILEGRLSIGGVDLSVGDFLHTEQGEEHDATASEECTFLVTSDGGIEVTEE